MGECIFWKGSKFRERKDSEKGVILSLPPRKMMRTVESKLNGTTRLGVCRGDVSGEGAALSCPVSASVSDENSTSLVPFNSDTQALSMMSTTASNPLSNEMMG